MFVRGPVRPSVLGEHSAMAEDAAAQSSPLCVDLDGTLIKTDSLFEALAAALRKNPLVAFQVPFLLLGGRASFKCSLMKRAQPDPRFLPYNPEVVDFLKKEYEQGRRIFLVTGAPEDFAQSVARHLGFFAAAFGTKPHQNLTGPRKLQLMKEKWGRFDYMGNDRQDLVIWAQAEKAYVVRARPGVERRAQLSKNVEKVMGTRTVSPFLMIKAMRVHQWVKNLLVFLPVFLAHGWKDSWRITNAVEAFISFGFCASGIYLLNDFLDMESDRRHQSKRHRPLASGNFPIPWALALIPVLLTSGLYLAWHISASLLAVTAGYVVTTSLYSFYAKKKVIMDALILAGLYTLRLFAGAEASQVVISQWLIAFSMFLFLSLAFTKRYSELKSLLDRKLDITPGRGYLPGDLAQVETMGISSGYMAVLIIALYASSPEAVALYRHAKTLWLVCPLLLYWISRLWMSAHRGEMNEDPIVHAVKDRVSWIVAALIIICAYAAL